MRYLVPLLLFLSACIPQTQAGPDPYVLSAEEVAYMVGCIEMGERLHITRAPSICADMDIQFLKRHQRPGGR